MLIAVIQKHRLALLCADALFLSRNAFYRISVIKPVVDDIGQYRRICFGYRMEKIYSPVVRCGGYSPVRRVPVGLSVRIPVVVRKGPQHSIITHILAMRNVLTENSPLGGRIVTVLYPPKLSEI